MPSLAPRLRSLAAALALLVPLPACTTEPFVKIPNSSASPPLLEMTSASASSGAPGSTPSGSPGEAREMVVFAREGGFHAVNAVESYGVDLVGTAKGNGNFHTSDIVYEQRDIVRFEDVEGVADALLVKFGAGTVARIHDGRQTTQAAPLAHKSYRVTLQGDKAVITDPAGGHVPRGEGKLVALRFQGRASRVAAHARFTSRPVRVGDRSDALESMLRADFAGGIEAARFGDVVATLVGTRDVDGVKCGVFRARVDVTLKTPNGLAFENDLRGEILVRTRDGLLARIDLTGPATMTGAIDGVEVTADGHAVLRVSHRFE